MIYYQKFTCLKDDAMTSLCTPTPCKETLYIWVCVYSQILYAYLSYIAGGGKVHACTISTHAWIGQMPDSDVTRESSPIHGHV